jgi:hypothetical protein
MGISVVFQNENGFVTDFGEEIKFANNDMVIPRYGIWQSQRGIKGGRPQVVKTCNTLDEATRFLAS